MKGRKNVSIDTPYRYLRNQLFFVTFYFPRTYWICKRYCCLYCHREAFELSTISRSLIFFISNSLDFFNSHQVFVILSIYHLFTFYLFISYAFKHYSIHYIRLFIVLVVVELYFSFSIRFLQTRFHTLDHSFIIRSCS